MKRVAYVLVLICMAMGMAFAKGQQGQQAAGKTNPPPAQTKPAPQTSPPQTTAAQTKPAATKEINNWISGEISLFGGGFRYERMLTPEFSIGAEFYGNTLIWWNEFGFIVAGRYYLNKEFFLELGLGYNTHTGDSEWEYDDYNYDILTGTRTPRKGKATYWTATSGLCLSPGVGWRIDPSPSKPGGFFMSPGIKLPVTIGTKEPVLGWYWNNKSEFGASIGILIYFGMGFAF